MASRLIRQGDHTSKGPKITDHLTLDYPSIALHFVVTGLDSEPGLHVEYVAEGGIPYGKLFKQKRLRLNTMFNSNRQLPLLYGSFELYCIFKASMGQVVMAAI